MAEEKKDPFKSLGNLSFIDQIADGFRKVGESIQIQSLLDDVFYMTSKYSLNVFLSVFSKLTIQGKAMLIANRGLILTTLASNYLDILLMTQVVEKKMYFIYDEKYIEKPVLKSVLKSFGFVASIQEMLNGEKDPEIFELIRQNRKILAIVVDEETERALLEQYFTKLMQLARDGFCPIIPVGFVGTDKINLGSEVIIRIGESIGVNQNTRTEDLRARALDLIDNLYSLRSEQV
ncbi:MAG: hypothetical protein ACTSRA_18990 [Promethearchaeota archaeon]